MKKYIVVFSFLFQFADNLSAQVTIIDSIISGGIYRNYRLYVPAVYNGSTARPLVFNLHGYTSSASAQQLYTNFDAIADTANFLIVYPNGTLLSGQPFWNAGFGQPVNDIQFISNLIDSISAQYNIDLNCVYSCGMSNGGYMSHTLACELSSRIAAVASVTGSMTLLQKATCNPNRAVPVMQIHGTADPTVPYIGSTGSLHIDSLVKYWVINNGCNTAPVFTNVPNTNLTDGCTAEHYVYSGGTNGSSVELYKIINGGHTWPGMFPIGPTCQDFNGSIKIWQFFRKYKLNQFVGINEMMSNETILFYPNPVTDKIIVKESFESLQIFDITGKLFKTYTENVIDVSDLQAGMYFLRIEMNNTFYTQKIIKQ